VAKWLGAPLGDAQASGDAVGYRLVTYPTYAVLDRLTLRRPPDAGLYLPRRLGRSDHTGPGALWLSLYVSSDYGGGHITFTGDGTVKQMRLPT
jgi:hypothetical protein